MAIGVSYTHAQPPAVSPPADWHFRYDLFQMTLEQSGLSPETELQTVLAAPTRSVIVALGTRSISQLNSSLRHFLRSGGRVLLSSDDKSESVLGNIPGGRVEAPTYSQYQYPDCVRIDLTNSDSPLATGVSQAIVNRSSWISRLKGNLGAWETSGHLPLSVTPQRAGGEPVIATLTLHGDLGGRGVLCADPSLLSNGMMWHGDNALLAINLSRFLSDGDRDQVFVIVDGQPQGSYADELARLQAANLPELPIDAMPGLELQQMLRVANKVVANTEDADLLNAFISDRPRRLSERIYRRILLLFLGAVMVLFAVYWLSGKVAKPGSVAHLPGKGMRPIARTRTSKSAAKPNIQRAQSAKLLASNTLETLTGSSQLSAWQQLCTAGQPPQGEKLSGEQLRGLKLLLEIASADPPKPQSLPELIEVDKLSRGLLQKTSTQS